MPIIRPSFRAFRAIGDALGILTAEAVTEFEVGPVRPRLNVQASLEAGVVRYSEFILLRTDVGAADTTVDVDVHVFDDWTEMRSRGQTFPTTGVPGSEVPEDHDAWIIRIGISTTVSAAFLESEVWTETPTLGAGAGFTSMFHADQVTTQGFGARGATLESPIMMPLPWFVPPLSQSLGSLRMRLRTSAITSTNLVLGVLSAPAGVFRRLYGG